MIDILGYVLLCVKKYGLVYDVGGCGCNDFFITCYLGGVGNAMFILGLSKVCAVCKMGFLRCVVIERSNVMVFIF